MKRIAVLGTGYVGLTVGNCLAKLGNQVVCVDKDAGKIDSLNAGKIPIFEPGMEELVQANLENKTIAFTTDLEKAVRDSEIIFIAVGTPMDGEGKADLTAVKMVGEQIGKALNGYKVIVNKSTVPVGTGSMVKELISRHTSHAFDVVSNPEFLREGKAIGDFLNPDRVVIGNGDSEKARSLLKELYAPLNAPILFTGIESAELIKYASNSFLATKISFINEVANFCEKVGGDVSIVAKGMGLDPRIGEAFLNAGAGYGGSCFPKDVKALITSGKEHQHTFRILETVEKVNEAQKQRMVDKTKNLLGTLEGKTITVLGLSFKPNTDDVREAPALSIIPGLQQEGAIVRAHDPVATGEAKPHLQNVVFFDSPEDACRDADAVIILTEWDPFSALDLSKLRRSMKGDVMVDGRNIFPRDAAEKAGFRYSGVGQ